MDEVLDDERWMRVALGEGRRGVGRTSPNPPVGAVVVSGGRELGRGWHRRAGAPHAERVALDAARESAGPGALRGSTVYVTLEPCSTTGRTPPCTAALIAAGCRRVVFGATDPNPSHAGRAVALLEAAGIEVRGGVLEAECTALIRGFASVQQRGRPWLCVKLAMSLDGRLTRPPGEGMWLTGPQARAEVQRLRAAADAILTSGETLRRDDPALTVRDPALLEGRDPPWRVVLTRDPASLPTAAMVFHDPWRDRTLVRPLDQIEAVLCELATRLGCCSVLVEAGGRMAGLLHELDLVDEWCLFLAPLVTGGPVPAVGGPPRPAAPLENPQLYRFGPDLLLRATIRRNQPPVPRP